MDAEYRVELRLVPARATVAELVAEVAKGIRNRGLPAETCVRPAKGPAFAIGRVIAQRRAAELEVAPILRRIQQQRPGGQRQRNGPPSRPRPSQPLDCQDRGDERRREQICRALGGQGETEREPEKPQVPAQREISRAYQPEGQQSIILRAGGLQDRIGKRRATESCQRLDLGIRAQGPGQARDAGDAGGESSGDDQVHEPIATRKHVGVQHGIFGQRRQADLREVRGGKECHTARLSPIDDARQMVGHGVIAVGGAQGGSEPNQGDDQTSYRRDGRFSRPNGKPLEPGLHAVKIDGPTRPDCQPCHCQWERSYPVEQTQHFGEQQRACAKQHENSKQQIAHNSLSLRSNRLSTAPVDPLVRSEPDARFAAPLGAAGHQTDAGAAVRRPASPSAK